MIYLLSAPVQSGKTTSLMKWARDKQQVQGFLTPDIAGCRMLYDLGDGRMLPFEVAAGQSATREYVRVGKYCFYAATFDYARKLLLRAANAPSGCFIVDEVGRLELEGKGFEPALTAAIEVFKSSEASLVLVIRDSLLQRARQHYQLETCPFFDFPE